MVNDNNFDGGPTFVAYIDESGDEGFRFNKGSSEWFVLAAIIIRKTKDLEAVKLVDSVRTKLGKPENKPLHFRDLKHEQRLVFVGHIAKADLSTISVFVHKPSIKEIEKFQKRYRLYFYAVRFLLERISWYCRDNKEAEDVGDGSAIIVFSNRSGISYQEMRYYLDILKVKTMELDVRIDWSIVKPEQIIAFTPGKRMGLQIADATASSFYYAVESSPYGYTEDRYARMLKPVVYNRQGRYLGYGLKIFPPEIEEEVELGQRPGWLKSDYQ